MKATHLKTEYLDRPLGLGIVCPRFYWICDGGLKQTASRVRATQNDKCKGQLLTNSN